MHGLSISALDIFLMLGPPAGFIMWLVLVAMAWLLAPRARWRRRLLWAFCTDLMLLVGNGLAFYAFDALDVTQESSIVIAAVLTAGIVFPCCALGLSVQPLRAALAGLGIGLLLAAGAFAFLLL